MGFIKSFLWAFWSECLVRSEISWNWIFHPIFCYLKKCFYSYHGCVIFCQEIHIILEFSSWKIQCPNLTAHKQLPFIINKHYNRFITIEKLFDLWLIMLAHREWVWFHIGNSTIVYLSIGSKLTTCIIHSLKSGKLWPLVGHLIYTCILLKFIAK